MLLPGHRFRSFANNLSSVFLFPHRLVALLEAELHPFIDVFNITLLLVVSLIPSFTVHDMLVSGEMCRSRDTIIIIIIKALYIYSYLE